MSNSDRKLRDERRQNERYDVALDIGWSAGGDIANGRLIDISATGCYILAGGDISEGEVVRVYFPISDGRQTELMGEVINHEQDIGFGLRFVNLNNVQRDFIQKFAELHHNDLKPPVG